MNRRTIRSLAGAAAALAAALLSVPAAAQEVTLKFHHIWKAVVIKISNVLSHRVVGCMFKIFFAAIGKRAVAIIYVENII